MEIRAFRGWRYAVSGGDVSPFIAPPYDVLTAADKAELLARSERNIVAVDLPHVPPKEQGPEAEYAAAGRLLERWKASGVLAQDAAAALYVYEQAFEWQGGAYARRAMLCGVRATELGRDVIGHEHVFPGPLADRLRLTEHTRTQLSPIFGFYDDPGGRVAEMLAAATGGPTVAHGELRGVAERLWMVTAPAAIAAVAAALRDVQVFIADGHHRYTTARNYAAAAAARESVGPDHEANFVMFALVARDDPGLLILPTHRIFSSLHPDGSVEALAAASSEFDWRKCRGGPDVTTEYVEGLLAEAGPRAIALVSGTSATVWLVRLARPEAMQQAAPEQIEEWRQLPPAILHRLIIDRALRPWVVGQLGVEYTPQTRQVLDACRSGRAQLGACLPPIAIGSVQAVARRGASMPHKSTYFYPKLATGMVLKPLE